MVGGGSYFYKNKKYRPLEIVKKKLQLFNFRNFWFLVYGIFKKMLNASSEPSFNNLNVLV